MSTRALLLLKKRCQPVDANGRPLEWLVTNGLGGYASGYIAAPPGRRFHGLLIAAQPAPLGRVMLLHALDEHVTLGDGRTVALPTGRRQSDVAPLREFALQGGLPHWSFDVGPDTCLERTVTMPHDQNTVHITYRLVGGDRPVELRLAPWVDFRPHEGLLSAQQQRRYDVVARAANACEIRLDGHGTVLRLCVSGAARFAPDPLDWNDIPFDIERDRGYDAVGSMHGPGVFTVTLTPGTEVHLTASSEPWTVIDVLPAAEARELEWSRREHLLQTADPALQTAATCLLPLAADQFIVRPAARLAFETHVRAAGAEPRTVIAGYPWFTDWGRDTMISLDGLTLVTGRHREARDILHSFAMHVRNGLIPNLFPEGERDGLYHTADATLWFFHALHRYDTVTGDQSLVRDLLPTLEDIVRCHRAGTSFNIHVDGDGLLVQGAEGKQLTWMDAKVDDWVVTPRRGKAVEINALWHNALMLLHSWLVRAERGLVAGDLAQEAQRCREAFNERFWNAAKRMLFDVVDGEAGDDDACRPNQVLAIAVEYPPLDRTRWADVLEAVASQLLTPYGLRTLAPGHPDYKARYFGDLRARDAAYHQGTAWPWLVGPFVDAWIKCRPDDMEGARAVLDPLLEHLTGSGCAGSISEIFDAESPYIERGCCAQAWSVAEMARLITRLGQSGSVGE